MNEKIKFLQKKKQQLQAFSLMFLVGLIFCLIFAIKAPSVGGTFALIMLLIHFFGIRPASKRYIQAIKVAHIQEGFRSLIKQITYKDKNGISKESIAKAVFLPVAHENNIVIRDTITGTYQAMPLMLTDVTTDYESATATNKAGVDYLPGCYMEVKLSKKPAFDFALLSENSIPASAIETRYITMIGSNLHVSGKTEHTYRLYLPEGVSESQLPEDLVTAFVLLDEYTPGMIALQVKGHYVRIFIRNRFLYTHDLKLHTPVTPQLLGNAPFPEIHAMLRVVDTLKA